jgi:hypothetical protein
MRYHTPAPDESLERLATGTELRALRHAGPGDVAPALARRVYATWKAGYTYGWVRYGEGWSPLMRAARTFKMPVAQVRLVIAAEQARRSHPGPGHRAPPARRRTRGHRGG